VAESARDLFIAQGFATTTVADVARAAGVSQQLIYSAFGGKRGLLEKVLDWTISGDDEDVPLAERPTILAVRDEPSIVGKVALYARHLRVLQERAAPTMSMLRAAADADLDARTVLEKIEGQRRAGMGMFVADLLRVGQLRENLDEEQAADAVWALVPDVLWSMLVGKSGWSPLQFEQWIAGQLAAAVLSDSQVAPVRRRSRQLARD
jgi:AcrR family transcriptional regulator